MVYMPSGPMLVNTYMYHSDYMICVYTYICIYIQTQYTGQVASGEFSGVPINLKRNQGKTKFGFLLFELIAEYLREDTHGGACMTGIADALSGGAC